MYVFVKCGSVPYQYVIALRNLIKKFTETGPVKDMRKNYETI